MAVTDGCCEQDIGTWRSMMGCCEEDIRTWRSLMGCCEQDIGTWRSVLRCCEQDIATWRSVIDCLEGISEQFFVINAREYFAKSRAVVTRILEDDGH